MDIHQRPHPRRNLASVLLAALVMAAAGWLAGTTTAATAAPPAVPAGAATSTAPAPSPSPSGCPATLFQGRWYCGATISKLQARGYPSGQQVMLWGVSVVSRTSTTVTVAAWESKPCTPGHYCGASLTLYSLTVPWTGTARPLPGAVIDLFGTATGSTLAPLGYRPNSTACYVDWC